MSRISRGRIASLISTMVLAIIGADHVAGRMRAVDFLTLFASGVLFGVSIVGLIRGLRHG